MTKKYLFTLSIGYSGAEHREVFDVEFEDGATEEQMDKELESSWSEWARNYIDGGWSETDEEK